jgi:hypothetical protein
MDEPVGLDKQMESIVGQQALVEFIKCMCEKDGTTMIVIGSDRDGRVFRKCYGNPTFERMLWMAQMFISWLMR